VTQPAAAKATKPQGIGAGTLGQALLVPALAVLSGLIIGAIAILAIGENVLTAYGALFRGSFGSLGELIDAIQVYFSTGENKALLSAIYPFTESLTTATPYIFAGLSVALGFRCGLFNIGGEGQVLMGALCSAFVGYSLKGLPAIIHLPLALLGDALGGAV